MGRRNVVRPRPGPGRTDCSVANTGNISQLKGGVELLRKLERKHQRVLLDGELRALHWKQGHAKLDLMVQDLKNYIPTLEKILKSREEGEAKARSYFVMTNKVNYDHKQEVLQHKQQVLTGLKGRIEYYKRQQIAELQSLDKNKKSTAMIRYLERVLLYTKLKAASRIRFSQLCHDAKKMCEKNVGWVERLAAEVKELGLK